jgi:hypothetical protein
MTWNAPISRWLHRQGEPNGSLTQLHLSSNVSGRIETNLVITTSTHSTYGGPIKGGRRTWDGRYPADQLGSIFDKDRFSSGSKLPASGTSMCFRSVTRLPLWPRFASGPTDLVLLPGGNTGFHKRIFPIFPLSEKKKSTRQQQQQQLNWNRRDHLAAIKLPPLIQHFAWRPSGRPFFFH